MRTGTGRSLGDWLLFGLIGLVAVISLVAIARSMNVQKQLKQTFEGWHEDVAGYQQALMEQEQTKKTVLVYFYADWCPYCRRFNAETLSSDQVREFVKDYPHVRIAPDHGQTEKAMMQQFGADGYPSFYVIPYGRAPVKIEVYKPDDGEGSRLKTPEEFIESIQQAAGETTSPGKSTEPAADAVERKAS